MKATEHIFERGIGKKVEPDTKQHRFMLGKKTTDGILVVRQMHFTETWDKGEQC